MKLLTLIWKNPVVFTYHRGKMIAIVFCECANIYLRVTEKCLPTRRKSQFLVVFTKK